MMENVFGSGGLTREMNFYFFIVEDTTPTTVVFEEDKQLAKGEFKWSINHCWVSMEIDGKTLTVEWETMSPTENDHYAGPSPPPLADPVIPYLIRNRAWRDATTTLTWDGLTLDSNIQTFGQVYKSTSAAFDWVPT